MSHHVDVHQRRATKSPPGLTQALQSQAGSEVWRSGWEIWVGDLGDLGWRFGRSGLEIWDFWVSDLGDPGQRSGRSGSFPQHEGGSAGDYTP